MSYRIRENGAILTQGEVRQLHAGTSFPAVWDQAVCDQLGIDPVLESPTPTTTRFQSASQSGAEQDSLGNWVYTWTITDWSEEAIASATATQWDSIRTTRNQKLSACDWTQLPDAPVDQAAWATYRQALRDVTTQTDPFNITWAQEPTKETP